MVLQGLSEEKKQRERKVRRMTPTQVEVHLVIYMSFVDVHVCAVPLVHVYVRVAFFSFHISFSRYSLYRPNFISTLVHAHTRRKESGNNQISGPKLEKYLYTDGL